jgi:signal transduction histidine kinase
VHLQQTVIAEQLEKNRLKELNDLKSYFVSIVTHELKTPLTSIKMFTELIEGSPRLQRRKRNEYLGIIKGESDRLSRLIDNVLDISKIEKGMKEYRFTAVDLNECVKEALATMQFQLTLHGFACRTHVSRRRLMLHADRDAVIEIIINLLSNAIKYSPHKKSVTVLTRQTTHGPLLSVEDRGVGIAPADLEKIFEPFERTDAALVRHTPGTGLGLALVKHIAEAHKARVDVESTPGKGTRFSITFPGNSMEGIQ